MSDLAVKRNRLFDAYFFDARMSQPTYERQVTHVDQEVAQAQVQLGVAQVPEIDLSRTLAFAQTLLEDLIGTSSGHGWKGWRTCGSRSNPPSQGVNGQFRGPGPVTDLLL